LDSLLNSGKVSAATYDWLDKGLVKITDKMKDLKEILEQEEDSRKSNLVEQISVLERTLASLELRYIGGDVNVEQLEHVRTILTLGLDSLRSMETPDARTCSRPDPPDLAFDEETEKAELEDTTKTGLIEQNYTETIPDIVNLRQETRDEGLANVRKNYVKSQYRRKSKRRFVRNRADSEGDSALGVHCRNPWDSPCSNTDIELSIYYEGELLPICRKCWQEISQRGLEWSGV